MNLERIERELTLLREGGQEVDLLTVSDHQACVLLPRHSNRRYTARTANFDRCSSPGSFRLSRCPDRSGRSTGGVAFLSPRKRRPEQPRTTISRRPSMGNWPAIIRITAVAGHHGTKSHMDFTLTSTISSLGWTEYDKYCLSEDGRQTINPSSRGAGVRRTSAVSISALPEF